MTHARDEFERTADFYNGQIPTELRKLRDLLADIEAYSDCLTYRQGLNIRSQCEDLWRAMTFRDMFGAHSDTGRDRFRAMAHPELSPKAPETAVV